MKKNNIATWDDIRLFLILSKSWTSMNYDTTDLEPQIFNRRSSVANAKESQVRLV